MTRIREGIQTLKASSIFSLRAACIETRVGAGAPSSPQYRTKHGYLKLICDLPRQQVGLVERTVEQAAAMKRHRHDTVWQLDAAFACGKGDFPTQDLAAG